MNAESVRAMHRSKNSRSDKRALVSIRQKCGHDDVYEVRPGEMFILTGEGFFTYCECCNAQQIDGSGAGE